MFEVLVSYMQLRGRGRNRRFAVYCFFGVMIVGLIYFYPRKKYFREDTRYQSEDLQRQAELFVKDHVEERDFFESDDYNEDWKHDKVDDDDDDDDFGEDDDGDYNDENTEDETNHGDNVKSDMDGVKQKVTDKHEKGLEHKEKNKWIKDDAFSRKKLDNHLLHDDGLEIPGVEGGEEKHDDQLEIPDVNDQIGERNDVELPDAMVEDNDRDELKAPNAEDNQNTGHHADDVGLPQGGDVDNHGDHVINNSNNNNVHDENLEAPDVNDQIPKGNNLEAPEAEHHEADDNLPVPAVKDKEIENYDVIPPDGVDDIVDKANEENNRIASNDNVDAPNVENQGFKGDNIEHPGDNRVQHIDDLKAPEAAEEELHRDDLQVPVGDDAHVGTAAKEVQSVVEGNKIEQKVTYAKGTDMFKAKNINGRSLGACDSERTNLVYIKMIKCASETMVSMLRRFGYSRELNFVQPVDKRIYVGWPYQINAGYYRANKGKDFNILCEHSVYNKTILSGLMPKNTVYITTIREPYSQVKSMFKYYKLDKSFKLEHLEDPFTEYIRNVEKYEQIYKHTDSRLFRQCIPDNFSMSSDLMSFNLGFPTAENGKTPDKTHDDVMIDQWLKDIDNSFSLVMIVEYFDESLILLKRIMCWTWKDIMYYSSNVLSYTWKQDNNAENVRIYKARSRVDYKLYDHFNQTFWRRVQNEKNDFWGEVATYKRIWHEVHQYCENTPNNMIYNLHENQWSRPFSINKNDCTDFVHYWQIFQRIKERYDVNPVKVNQPKIEHNVC